MILNWSDPWSTQSKTGPKTMFANIPSEPHYVIMKIVKSSYSSQGYDRGDPDYNTVYEDVSYRSFTDKGEWEKAIDFIYNERVNGGHDAKIQHVFFHSGGRIEPKLSVTVNVSMGGK